MFNISKFFQPAYLFDLRPGIDPLTLQLILIIFIAMLIVAIVCKIVMLRKQWQGYQLKLGQKYFFFLISLGIAGLMIAFFRYERTPLLSARFWLPIWLIWAIVWLALILKYQLKVVPEAKKRLENKQLFQKYLPKKKK